MSYYCFAEVIYESPNSTLYRAFSQNQSRQVVFKCFENDAQGMYLREMSGFGMTHPNLIACLDTFYLADGRPCVMYEFFQDGTLEQWLSTHGKADLVFCYRCLEDVLQALVYLNQNKRIHCDIKPGNIFLRSSSAAPYFILGDLGATCSLREAQESRYGVGTPAYIAPERLYDRFFYNSDLYSLGVVAFELITGTRPFLGMPDEIKRAHLSKLPDLEKIADLGLRNFIERLLEKDPELRIADAKTALSILNAIRAGQCIAEPVKISLTENIKVETAITPSKFNPYYQFSITTIPNKLLPFVVNNQLLIGLEYDSHIDLINPHNHKRDIVLKNGITQWHQLDSFFYTSSLKLFQFDLSGYQKQCVYQFNKNISYFQCGGDYLLLRSKYDSVYCHLPSKQVYKFVQPHYFSAPQACILENGQFCLSGGMTNHELILRDEKTNILAQWQLAGPILAVLAQQQTVLVLTLDMQNSSAYKLSCLHQTEAPRCLTFSNREIVHYCQTENALFWLNADNQLFICTIALIPKLIAQLPVDLTLAAFQLSLNHRWLVAVTNRLSQEHQMICFKADGE